MIVDAEAIGTDQPKATRRVGSIWRGALVAVFTPVPFLTLVGLLIAWRETFPNAKTLPEALFQAVAYIPGMILADLIAVIFTFPAIIAWAVLRSRRWAPWYVCMILGLASGWSLALLFTAGNDAGSAFGRHVARYIMIEFCGAGTLTGLVVWLADRGTQTSLRGE